MSKATSAEQTLHIHLEEFPTHAQPAVHTRPERIEGHQCQEKGLLLFYFIMLFMPFNGCSPVSISITGASRGLATSLQ